MILHSTHAWNANISMGSGTIASASNITSSDLTNNAVTELIIIILILIRDLYSAIYKNVQEC